MSLFWGLTWIAVKVGVAAVPPALFAGTRFLAAGLILTAACGVHGCGTRVGRRHWGGSAPSPC